MGEVYDSRVMRSSASRLRKHNGGLGLLLVVALFGVQQQLLCDPGRSTPPQFAIASSREVARQINQYRRTHEHEIVRELVGLLSIPNIANDQSNIRKNAVQLVQLLSRRGFQTRIFPLAGRGPVVFGQLNVPHATRTVLFYCHYDGQPVEKNGWTNTKPFEPALRTNSIEAGGQLIPFPESAIPYRDEWRIYARSAADDKSPIIAILSAIDALRSRQIPLVVNVKVILDGEEEAGSPHLAETLIRYKSLLRGDVLICADGPIHPTGKNQLIFGNRGIVLARIIVYGPTHPLHSGHYGNWVPNPAMRLAQLLASMKDSDGHVLISGFYDDVAPLGAAENQALQEAPQSDRELMKEFGIAHPDGHGKTLLQLITEPSLNIDELDAGLNGPQAETVVPDRAEAKLDMRLVKNIQPERQVERLLKHIQDQGYAILDHEPTAAERLRLPLIARVESEHGYPAVSTPMDLPVSREIMRVVDEAAGEAAIKLPLEGGSVPMYIFEELGLPVISVPMVNFDDNQHAPDENLRIGNLWRGMQIYGAILATANW